MSGFWVYMLRCGDSSLYTGSTADLAERLRQHQEGSARCHYTRSHQPVQLACCWTVSGSRGDALRVERLIKKLKCSAKERLVATPELLTTLAAETLNGLEVIGDNPQNTVETGHLRQTT